MEQVNIAPVHESAVARLTGELVQDAAACQPVDKIVGCRVRGPGQFLNVADRNNGVLVEIF